MKNYGNSIDEFLFGNNNNSRIATNSDGNNNNNNNNNAETESGDLSDIKLDVKRCKFIKLSLWKTFINFLQSDKLDELCMESIEKHSWCECCIYNNKQNELNKTNKSKSNGNKKPQLCKKQFYLVCLMLINLDATYGIQQCCVWW